MQPGYDIDKYDYSVLTRRSIKEIAGDAGAAEWESNRKTSPTRSGGKNDWLADSIAKADAKKAKKTAKPASKSGDATPENSTTSAKKSTKSAATKASTKGASTALKKKARVARKNPQT